MGYLAVSGAERAITAARELARPTGGGPTVAAVAAHLPLLVDGPTQVSLFLAAIPKEEHLVHKPCHAWPPAVLVHLRREQRAEGLDPAQHRAPRDVEPAPGEEHHHAGGGQRVRQGPPHRHQDHLRRPAVAREGRHRGRPVPGIRTLVGRSCPPERRGDPVHRRRVVYRQPACVRSDADVRWHGHRPTQYSFTYRRVLFQGG